MYVHAQYLDDPVIDKILVTHVDLVQKHLRENNHLHTQKRDE
jgi:hypothetical protein